MYKLIIADDEEEVRKGIINKIDWSSIGFQVVGEAGNGREALDIAEKTLPDVVITDIKMPFLDGLALSKELIQRYPTIKIVVLTGFDEFEYAKEAIKLKVVDYILKPVSSKELVDIILSVKKKIDDEIAEKEDIIFLRKCYNESLPIMKWNFMQKLICGNLSTKEITDKSSYYNIDLTGEGFIASVINFDFADNSSWFNSKKNINKWEEKELLKFAVFNICTEFIDKSKIGFSFLNSEEIVIIGITDKYHKSFAIENIITTLDKIKQAVEKYLKFRITIGLGTYESKASLIKNSYKNALSALDYRLVLGSGKIIFIEDIEPHTENKLSFDEYRERELVSSIKTGNVKEVTSIINKLLYEITKAQISIKDSQVYLLEMLTAIIKTAKDFQIDLGNIFGKDDNLFLTLDKMRDMEELKEWMNSTALKILENIKDSRQDTSKTIVCEAKEYVNKLYYESDININKICNHLHISANYFSFIFKKEAKMTFVNYLTEIRMEKAKELLHGTNLKTFQVAEKVGYLEPNYFSYCFKKKFGVSPSEYRRR